MLKEKKGIFRALRYEYEAIGRRYQKQLALSDNDYLINLPVNHYVEDIFGPNFIAAPFSLSGVYEKNETVNIPKLSHMKKQDLIDECVSKNIACIGTVRVLRERLRVARNEEKA